ncbi:hypothetical protein [Polyangium mundeleinium]|uniref:Uncharacterized protein n=1 Tax=Polyangium mundeleinium TaxID=2995306 RepID=A0ABT5EWB6_9BACT|nr:hypothetical protein [Polyangium mundeleinium]MDC0745076.1 hypothetical protein [Polyangium mundeleinium]
MGERMPDLATELQTVVNVMATGPRKKSPTTWKEPAAGQAKP